MANNNEKILNLLTLKSKLPDLIQKYLDNLQAIYNWENQTKKNFFRVKRSISDSIVILSKKNKKLDRELEEKRNIVNRINSEASELLEENVKNISLEGRRGLEELIDLQIDNLTEEYVELMLNYIRENVSIPKGALLRTLRRGLNYVSVGDEGEVKEVVFDIIHNLKAIRTEMGRSYKEFDIKEVVGRINLNISRLQDINELEAASELESISSMIQSEEPSRMDSGELEEIIHVVRQPSLYIRRGYTVLEYSTPVYKEMNYFLRALRENRGYIGTQNAYNRLIEALNNLETYYKTYYNQAGGSSRFNHEHTAKLT